MSSSGHVVGIKLLKISLLILCCGTVRTSVQKHRCMYATPQGKYAADCADRGLDDVPKDLQTNIEVLDLSRNNIRRIANESFSLYTSIKFLYLSKNNIKRLEYGAFMPLSSLNVLDLSMNGLTKFTAYCPPSVVRLYLADNNLNSEMINVTSITSLGHLSLAYCELERFPQLGLLPNLLELNMTGNLIFDISATDLAPLCNLKSLYIDTLFINYPSNQTLCDCLKLEKWTSMHQIQVYSFTCKYEKAVKLVCNTEPPANATQIYSSCVSEYHLRKLPIVVLSVAGVLAVIIFIMVLVYVKCRRRKKSPLSSPKRSSHKTRSPTERTTDEVMMKFDNHEQNSVMVEK